MFNISEKKRKRYELSINKLAVYLKLNLRRTFAYNVETAEKEEDRERERVTEKK